MAILPSRPSWLLQYLASSQIRCPGYVKAIRSPCSNSRIVQSEAAFWHLASDKSRTKIAKPSAASKCQRLCPYSPQMPTSGKASLGLSDWLWGRAHTLYPPHASQGMKARSDYKIIRPAQSASSGIFAMAERTDNRSQDQRPANGIGATSGKHSADTEPLRL